MTKGFPHALHGTDIPITVPDDPGCGVEAIKKKFFGHYESVSIDDLLREYDERIDIFREFGRHGEARILEEGKRTWNDLRPRIGERRFKEELIMSLALALHATFSITTAPSGSKRPGIVEIRKKVVHGTERAASKES